MSAHPQHDAVGGNNPNYYDETANAANVAPLNVSHNTTSLPNQSPPQTQSHGITAQQEYYPPPPPGPPPSHQDQQYYPPPPTGPPPSQSGYSDHPNSLHSHPYMSGGAGGPSGSPTETLPGYKPIAQPGLHAPGDEKPPAMPPRPSSSQGGSVSDGLPGYTPAPAGLHVPGDEKPPAMSPRPNSSQGQSPYFAGPPGGDAPGYVPPIDQQQANKYNTSVTGLAPPPGGISFSSGNTSEGEGHGSGKVKTSLGQKLYAWTTKAGAPINKLTNKLGSEAFWPSSLDKECDKAARILNSFCKKGVEATLSSDRPPPSPGHPTSPGPKSSSKTLVKIPEKVIKQAKGLAIFTVFRTGFHISGASGSGVVISRLPDGSWSPPSGFLAHTLGAGLMVGIDIYDCVCVLNTEDAVRAFTKPRLSLGAEIAVAAGPVGAGTSIEGAVGKSVKPIWSYTKSRGLFAGVQADATIIIQRPDANGAFYGEDKIAVDKILRNEVQTRPKQRDDMVVWPEGARQLIEVLKVAEGYTANEGVLKEVDVLTPGDLHVEKEGDGVHREQDGDMMKEGTRLA